MGWPSMTSRILASQLMRTAEKLVPSVVGRGRPARSDLRRATSTAYYAVFHQILRHGALVVLPHATEDDIARVARWHSHAAIKKASDSVVRADSHLKNGAPVPKDHRAAVDALVAASSGQGAIPADLITACRYFSSLQDSRAQADYDGLFDPTRREVRSHIDDAQEALECLWRLWRRAEAADPADREAHETYRVFLLLALGWSSSFARAR